MSISKFYDIWLTLRHVGDMSTTFPIKIPNTPNYLPYSDEDQNKTTFGDLDEEVMPEVGNKYVHASIMLPCGSQLMHGTVKACKQDLDGNPICCQSDNPILDT